MSLRGTVVVVVVATLVSAGWLTLADDRADRILAGTYGAALDEALTRWERPDPASVILSQFAETERGLPAMKSLMIGDRISIAAPGHVDAYEVVAIETMDGAVLGMAGVRLQVVTSRLEGVTGAENVKFIFAVEGGGTAAARKERSL